MPPFPRCRKRNSGLTLLLAAAALLSAQGVPEVPQLSVILQDPAERTASINFAGSGKETVLRWFHDGAPQSNPSGVVIKAAGTGATATATPEGVGVFLYEIGLADKTALHLTVTRPGLVVSLPQTHSGAMLTADDNQSVPVNVPIRLLLANKSNLLTKRSVRWKLRLGTREFCGEASPCDQRTNWSAVEFEGPSERVLEVTGTDGDGAAHRWWLPWAVPAGPSTEAVPAVLSLAHFDASEKFVGLQSIRWKVTRTPKPIEFTDRVAMLFYAGLGVLASFLLTFLVPNIRRRMAVKRQLDSLARRIREIPEKLPSAIEAGLRCEQIRLSALRRSVLSLWPRYRAVLDELDPAVKRLDQRVAQGEELSRLLTALRVRADLAGPSLTRYLLARRSLQEAAVVLMDPKDPTASPNALQRANALLLDPSPEEQQALAATVLQRLTAFRANGSAAPYQIAPLIAQLPLLPAAVDLDQWIEHRGAGAIDAELVLLSAAAGLPRASLPIVSTRPTLGQSADALAQILQLKGAPLAQRIRAKIANARIALDRESPRCYEPITFSVEFDDPALELVADQSGLLPVWDFTKPDARIPAWTVTRFFLPPSSYWADGKVLQRLRDKANLWWRGEKQPRLERVVKVQVDGHQITATISLAAAPPPRERNQKHLVLLLATVLPALLAIVWQATDLSPLSLITLGFTADRVKEALAGSNS